LLEKYGIKDIESSFQDRSKIEYLKSNNLLEIDMKEEHNPTAVMEKIEAHFTNGEYLKNIISLKTNDFDSYEKFLLLYATGSTFYAITRNEIAKEKYGKPLAELDKSVQREIRNTIPFILSTGPQRKNK